MVGAAGVVDEEEDAGKDVLVDGALGREAAG